MIISFDNNYLTDNIKLFFKKKLILMV